MDIEQLIILSVGCLVISFASTPLLLKLLHKHQIFDVPNDRSNHENATPRGGGIAILTAILLGFGYVYLMNPEEYFLFLPLLNCLMVLAAISWLDDLKGLSIIWRFLVHIGAVAVGTYYLIDEKNMVFQGLLPLWLDMFLAGFLWLWFLNLYNFMDGIDGITGAETLIICLGVGLISYSFETPLLAIIIGFSTLGFLFWNWHPARIFMGDVGSIPLGFLTGWLLLNLATKGHPIPALIIPAYYLADSGITLLKRLIRKEKIWHAHSEHFYQHAVRAGKSHSSVVKMIFLANILLIIAAFAASIYLDYIWYILLAAGIIVFLLLYKLKNTKTTN